jgi:ParB family chromosome partitioning protein
MSQKRSALGRGLGALISTPSRQGEVEGSAESERRTPSVAAGSSPEPAGNPDTAAGSASASELQIALIDPNPEQPRREFDPVALESLARSIGQHGVLQPVVVRRAGARFELIMGERRFRASQMAGRQTIPAVIADVAAHDRLELAIIENVQREDLNPIELALAYQALADVGHTQDEIGRKVSKDRSSIANHIRLLDLSRGIQTDVENGRLSMGHAKALLQVSDLEAREALRTRILNDSLSVRASEQAARELSGAIGRPRAARKAAPESSTRTLDPDTRAYAERIERHLQTRVTLHPSAGGGGRIEISYFDLEDLERLGSLLLGERG